MQCNNLTVPCFIIMLSIGLTAMAQQVKPVMVKKGLKDYYKNYFPVGVAVSPRSMQGKESELILSEFNSLTPENAMKMGPIHPEENRYNWRDADSIVNYAQAHGLKVRGIIYAGTSKRPNGCLKMTMATR